MRPDVWRRAEELFHAALEQSPETRRAFLDSACGNDAELRRQVDRLVSADKEAGSFLERTRAADPIVTIGAAGSLSGHEFGHYRIVSPLGVGGMGEVYRAHDLKLGRDVAIKTLPYQFARDRERVSRLRREARTLASLNHPHIAAIYGLEEFDETDFLVLELVEGQHPAGPLPIVEALRIGEQIAEALAAAHARGIVHRDLKPANVMITPQGQVKVLDFGLAKAVYGQEDEGTVQAENVNTAGSVAGHVIGTPGYMSPEQARGEQVDPRTDVWSFGCLLYELLTGERVFRANTVQETVTAVLEREPDWQLLPARTPAKVRRLLRHCLQKDVNHRLPAIGDALTTIKQAQNGVNLWRIAGALLLVAAAVIALWLKRPISPTDSSQWVPLTKFPDSVAQPALSPDGRMVAFVRGESSFYGPGQIYVKALPDGEPMPLTNDKLDKMSPVFSPDGSRIAYTTVNPDFQWDTWTVSVHGGEPQMMLKNASGLVWIGPRRIMFSEMRNGVHMAVVTSDENRAAQRDVYVPHNEPRHGAPFLSITRRQMGAGGGDGYRSLVGALPSGSRGWQFLRTEDRSSGWRLYVHSVVAGWEMDVLHVKRGGRESYLAPAFSRWQTGTDHGGSDRRGRNRDGLGRPLVRDRGLHSRRFPVASRYERRSADLSRR